MTVRESSPAREQRSRSGAILVFTAGRGPVLALLPPPSSLHATRPVIVVEHEPIVGLMNETMSLPFIAASTDLFGDLKVGDRISFGLKDTPDALLIIAIQRLGPADRR